MTPLGGAAICQKKRRCFRNFYVGTTLAVRYKCNHSDESFLAKVDGQERGHKLLENVLMLIFSGFY